MGLPTDQLGYDDGNFRSLNEVDPILNSGGGFSDSNFCI